MHILSPNNRVCHWWYLYEQCCQMMNPLFLMDLTSICLAQRVLLKFLKKWHYIICHLTTTITCQWKLLKVNMCRMGDTWHQKITCDYLARLSWCKRLTPIHPDSSVVGPHHHNKHHSYPGLLRLDKWTTHSLCHCPWGCHTHFCKWLVLNNKHRHSHKYNQNHKIFNIITTVYSTGRQCPTIARLDDHLQSES